MVKEITCVTSDGIEYIAWINPDKIQFIKPIHTIYPNIATNLFVVFFIGERLYITADQLPRLTG